MHRLTGIPSFCFLGRILTDTAVTFHSLPGTLCLGQRHNAGLLVLQEKQAHRQTWPGLARHALLALHPMTLGASGHLFLEVTANTQLRSQPVGK